MTKPEFVYVIGAADSCVVKIGRTTDIASRLAAIQRMSPAKLTVLWQTEGGPWLEAALHRKFKELRSHGEWFEFPDRDAPERVRSAIPELVAKAEAVQRAQEERRAKQRGTRKWKKARKVWTRPSRVRAKGRSTWKPTVQVPTSLAGYHQGEVVRIVREGWRYTETGVIFSVSPGSDEPFAVQENDGRKHYYLGMFNAAEIAHQHDVAELPRTEPCRLDGCMCATVV